MLYIVCREKSEWLNYTRTIRYDIYIVSMNGRSNGEEGKEIPKKDKGDCHRRRLAKLVQFQRICY